MYIFLLCWHIVTTVPYTSSAILVSYPALLQYVMYTRHCRSDREKHVFCNQQDSGLTSRCDASSASQFPLCSPSCAISRPPSWAWPALAVSPCLPSCAGTWLDTRLAISQGTRPVSGPGTIIIRNKLLRTGSYTYTRYRSNGNYQVIRTVFRSLCLLPLLLFE